MNFEVIFNFVKFVLIFMVEVFFDNLVFLLKLLKDFFVSVGYKDEYCVIRRMIIVRKIRWMLIWVLLFWIKENN